MSSFLYKKIWHGISIHTRKCIPIYICVSTLLDVEPKDVRVSNRTSFLQNVSLHNIYNG